MARARLRLRLRLRSLAWLAAAIAVAGCGHRTTLPEETRGGLIPASNTYTVKQVWQGFAGASDILLTSGSQVYVAFPDSGQVLGYFSTGSDPRPNGKVLEGTAPTYLAEGVGRTLIVADVDSLGGVICIYEQATGDRLRSFRDTTWVVIGGVAADDAGDIYVSDRESNQVRKYDGEGNFLLELADEGTGIGFVVAPGGLDWQPDQLLVVDGGKQWVQALDAHQSNEALFFVTGSDTPLGPFVDLGDVAGDEESNLYVADTGNRAVLKYDDASDYDQRVDINAPEGSSGHLVAPIALSANATLVYVVDQSDGKIVTFELDR